MKSIAEQTILFFSVLKWVLLATIVGIVVGTAVALFLTLLYGTMNLVQGFPLYFLALPLVLAAVTIFIQKYAPGAKGHGTEKVIQAVHHNAGRIKAAVVPVKLLATIVTISFGGSAGREGPAAQIGAGLMSAIAKAFRFDAKDHKKLVICGISAGFAAVFGTPIAGAIFGVEVLFVGGLLYDILLPSFVAGIIGYQVASHLGVTHVFSHVTNLPPFSEHFFALVVIAGIFFGLVSLFFIEVLESVQKISLKSAMHPGFKAFFAGLMLVLLTFIVGTDYLGLSTNLTETALLGNAISPWAFGLKTIFTAITLGFGGSGGVLTAVFTVGATSGNLFAGLFGATAVTFAAIGMVSLLAGTSNTPIAASIMAMELFGPVIAPFAAISCIVSFLITGHRSVFPSQVFAMSKSTSIYVHVGDEAEEVKPELNAHHPELVTLFHKTSVALDRHFFCKKRKK